MPTIFPHSVVDPKAKIADDVEIGPFCVVGPDVTLGAGCRLLSHVVVTGHTTVGANNSFFPTSVIGAVPQDLKFKGSTTKLEIGDNNVIREAVTLHLGTEKGGGVTRIGSNNLLMVNCHVGHDVQIGDRCIIANNVMFAGHVVVHDGANIAGGAAFHHFVTVGTFAYIGGYSRVHHDVPPFVIVDGKDKIRGLNVVGLRRNGFSLEDVSQLEEAVRTLFPRRGKRAFNSVLDQFDLQNGINPHVREMIEFLQRRNLGKHGRYLESQRGK